MRAGYCWRRLFGSGCVALTLCVTGGECSRADERATTELVIDSAAVDTTGEVTPETTPGPLPCVKCQVGEEAPHEETEPLSPAGAVPAQPAPPPPPACTANGASAATADGPPGTCKTGDETSEAPSVNALVPVLSPVTELANSAVVQEHSVVESPALDVRLLHAHPPQIEGVSVGLNELPVQYSDPTHRFLVSAAAPSATGPRAVALTPQQVTLRLRGLYFMALSENRTADAEAIAAALRALGVADMTQVSVHTPPVTITPPTLPMLGGWRDRLHTLPVPRPNVHVDRSPSPSMISRAELMRLRPYANLKLRVSVVGQLQGAVWGSGVYTDDSDLGTAAVHAGLVQPGQQAEVVISLLGPQARYQGSTSHGVATAHFAGWQGSYRFETGDHPDAAYYFSVEPLLSAALRELPLGVRVASWMCGNPQGGWVWGRDQYTADSSLPAAAVHAGVLKDGEVGLVLVETYPGLNNYSASESNGVTTHAWGPYPRSFRFVPCSLDDTTETALPR